MERSFGQGAPQSASIGQILFIGLAFLELIFVCFVTPALTAGTISGELERRTYDVLLATPLRPSSILIGKIFASLTYANLLILAAIPLSSIIFLFGGVVLRDVIQAIGLMIVVAITYGMMGVFFSALTRRTGRATALSYVMVLAFTFGTFFVWFVLTATGSGRTPPRAILYLNPLSAMASAIFVPGTMTGMRSGRLMEIFYFLTQGGGIFSGPVFQAPGRPLWQYTVALYLTITAILYVLTTQLVKPVRRWRIGWRNLAGLLLLLALIAGGLWVTFATEFGSTGWQSSNRQIATPPPPPMPEVIVRDVVMEDVEVPVEEAVADPPTPTPTPPPLPTPVPFQAQDHLERFEDYLAQMMGPTTGEIAICQVRILGSVVERSANARVFLWSYCRAFNSTDGEIVPAMTVSAPVVLDIRLAAGDDWEIDDHILGRTDQLPPEIQTQLREEPFDDQTADEELMERAQQFLTEEEIP
jgi:ABC-type transport system involved in multi-copper enzyme maturation permease subunit